ncbi:hypothetical protein Tagg_0062 [Thermosphaera aggregans DSM 11486]|uniref:Uncharacterized protein n=1 Tax=Thermosphaera aggregans (strain DSM 11486 / M11TL) TaxID=633148 RepID=D5TZP4_THEAM|nr:hypothetical protein Tagg_0062 [Thermosphaera aggregans DSM 11486]
MGDLYTLPLLIIETFMECFKALLHVPAAGGRLITHRAMPGVTTMPPPGVPRALIIIVAHPKIGFRGEVFRGGG